MIARSQEEILHVLSICEVCEQYRGQQKNAVGRTEVNCAACKTCGRKVISVEIQACPVGKFAAARMGAERKGEDMVVEDMYAQKRWEFLEKRNAQLAALKLGPVNEETLDCPGGEHFWPPGHRIGSFKNRRLGTGPDNRGRPVGAHVQPQPKRPDWGEPQLCRAVPEDMSGIFDRVVMISVEGRADRREKALPRMREQGWPFREPELKLVTHGDHIGVPKGWSHGGGAWGCMLSHREVLWQAIQDKVHTLLVMEDDAWVCDDFAAKVRQFLAHVPDDWGQIMFGGQLMGDGRQKRVNEHARRVSQCERTHCYALRGEAIRSLWLWWNQVGANAHCDWMMGDWQDHSHWPCYIPNQFLVAQMESRSDLTGRVEPLRTWSTDGAARAVAPASAYGRNVAILDGHGYERPPILCKHALVTLNMYGDKMPLNFRESLIAAATRWGVAYVEQRWPLPGVDKWQDNKLCLDRHFAGYERVMYVDRDVVIRSDCPSPFVAFGGDEFFACREANLVDGDRGVLRDKLFAHQEAATMCIDDYINSGVMLFSPQSHAKVFEEAREIIRASFYDYHWAWAHQGVLSVAISRTAKLGVMDEWVLVGASQVEGLPLVMDKYIYHFNGGKPLSVMHRVIWRLRPEGVSPR